MCVQNLQMKRLVPQCDLCSVARRFVASLAYAKVTKPERLTHICLSAERTLRRKVTTQSCSPSDGRTCSRRGVGLKNGPALRNLSANAVDTRSGRQMRATYSAICLALCRPALPNTVATILPRSCLCRVGYGHRHAMHADQTCKARPQ